MGLAISPIIERRMGKNPPPANLKINNTKRIWFGSTANPRIKVPKIPKIHDPRSICFRPYRSERIPKGTKKMARLMLRSIGIRFTWNTSAINSRA